MMCCTAGTLQINLTFPMTASAGASDLVATNIQRGRDHGLGSYNSARLLSGLSSAGSGPMSGLSRPQQIVQQDWDALAKLYRDPDDIDLFTGGMAEIHANGEGGTHARFALL